MSGAASRIIIAGIALDGQQRDILVNSDGTLPVTGGVGGGGGGDGAILDGVNATIKATVTGANALKVDGSAVTQPVSGPLTDAQLRAAAVPVSGTFFQATQPVSGTVTANAGTGPFPISDNAGSITVDAPVATPVAVRLSDGAAFIDPRDVSDRAARLLGHITVDNASIAVTGTFWQATQPVSVAAVVHVDDNAGSLTVDGTITANQGGAPWSQNLTQVGGTAITAKAVPTNADGQAALPIYLNSIQLATYDAGARGIVTGALTAGTAKAVWSIEHAAVSTKTVKIRRIMVHAIQTTALSGSFDIQLTRGTAASTAGSAVTPTPHKPGDPAAEAVVKTLPTITAATVVDNIPAGGFGATTALYSPPVLVYDWQEGGETKPYILRAGTLESLVVNVVSTAALNLTLTISVDFTEE